MDLLQGGKSPKKSPKKSAKKSPTKSFKKTVGSKAEVFHGTAAHTSGKLVKAQLMQNAAGRIISKKKHSAGKKAMKALKASGKAASPYQKK